MEWEIIKNIGIALTALIAVFGFYEKVLKPLIETYIEKSKKESLRDEKIDKIVYQLFPNGGGSIADKINTISSDQKYMMSKLDLTSQIQQSMLEEAKLPWWKGDGDGLYLSVSKEMLDIVGYHESDFLGSNWATLFEVEEIERILHSFNFAREKKVKWFETYTYKNKVKVESTAYPILDKNNNISGYFGIIKRIDND